MPYGLHILGPFSIICSEAVSRGRVIGDRNLQAGGEGYVRFPLERCGHYACREPRRDDRDVSRYSACPGRVPPSAKASRAYYLAVLQECGRRPPINWPGFRRRH